MMQGYRFALTVSAPRDVSKVLTIAQPKSHLGLAGGVHQIMKLLPEAPQYWRVPGDFMRTLAVQPIVMLPAHKTQLAPVVLTPSKKQGVPRFEIIFAA